MSVCHLCALHSSSFLTMIRAPSQLSTIKSQKASKQCANRHAERAAPPLRTLRDVENTPFRTFNRIQGPRGHLPANFYLSEYTGSHGSHPRMEPYWGAWGPLKSAGPYLATASPAYNPALAKTASRKAFHPDPLMTSRLTCSRR